MSCSPAGANGFLLDSYDFIAIMAGIATLLLAAGIATVRQPVLPRWLGWTAIVLGVRSLAGPIGFIGAMLGALWIIVVGILLSTRRRVMAGTLDVVAVDDLVVGSST